MRIHEQSQHRLDVMAAQSAVRPEARLEGSVEMGTSSMSAQAIAFAPEASSEGQQAPGSIALPKSPLQKSPLQPSVPETPSPETPSPRRIRLQEPPATSEPAPATPRTTPLTTPRRIRKGADDAA